MNYLTIIEAQQYFNERLDTDAWDYADDTDKTKALAMATKAIDRLNFIGDKTDESQELQFPRGGDAIIPTAINNACCEITISLLEGINSSAEIDDIRVISARFDNVSTTYNGKIAQEYVVAGIPSAIAWQLLVPYLRDTQKVSIDRV